MANHNTSLHLPEAMKLKGDENYPDWKEKVLNIAKSNGIAKYVHEKYKAPPEVDEFDEKASEEAVKLWQAHEAGDANM
jgi:hypothetical protein